MADDLQNLIQSTFLKIPLQKGRCEFQEKLDEHKDYIFDSMCDSKPVTDAYSNALLELGKDDPRAKYNQFALDNTSLDYALWLALYNDSWVFKRAIDKPAQDEIRNGITLQGEYDKDQIYSSLKRHKTDFINLLKWGALFGGAVACVMFDGMKDEDYKEPLMKNITKWKNAKYERFYVTDRWYGVSPLTDKTVTNMGDIDFGKPMYYDITLANGKRVTFHHDYVLRYEHRNAPNLIKNGLLQGWGYAEGAHIITELTRDEKLRASVQSLMDKASIEVIKMPGMRGLFAGTDTVNQTQIQKRLEMINYARNSNAITFLDKEDEYSQTGFSGLSGLSDIMEQNMWLISSALEMQGVLFGDLKNGFSNDTDALERYDETINGRCEAFVRPVYTKYISMLFKKYNINEPIEYEFNSILMNKKDADRVEAMKNFVDLGATLLTNGVITPQQMAQAFQTYTLKGDINFGLTDDVIKGMKETLEEEAENIDLDG